MCSDLTAKGSQIYNLWEATQLFKENLNTSRPSGASPSQGGTVNTFDVSDIQRIGCQPEKNTLHDGQSCSWSTEQGRENKK